MLVSRDDKNFVFFCLSLITFASVIYSSIIILETIKGETAHAQTADTITPEKTSPDIVSAPVLLDRSTGYRLQALIASTSLDEPTAVQVDIASQHSDKLENRLIQINDSLRQIIDILRQKNAI